jgi:lysophospholipase L1-like esterase
VVLYLGWNDLRYICSERPDDYRRRPISSSFERLLGRSALYGLIAYRLLGGTNQAAPDTPGQAVSTPQGKRQFRDNLLQMAAAIRQCNAQMVVCTQCMAAHPQASERVRDFVSHDPEVVAQMTALGQWVSNELREFAAAENAELVDVYRALPADQKHLADYIHLTAEGERQLARLLAERLHALLDDLEQRTTD